LPSEFHIRQASAGDGKACAVIHILARSHMRFLPQDIYYIDETVNLMCCVVFEEQTVWVADINDEIIAYASLGDGYLNNLYVDPDHQGQGIGGALRR
jgi:GNAT superfamily N-acetyltransferase